MTDEWPLVLPATGLPSSDSRGSGRSATPAFLYVSFSPDLLRLPTPTTIGMALPQSPDQPQPSGGDDRHDDAADHSGSSRLNWSLSSS